MKSSAVELLSTLAITKNKKRLGLCPALLELITTLLKMAISCELHLVFFLVAASFLQWRHWWFAPSYQKAPCIFWVNHCGVEIDGNDPSYRLSGVATTKSWADFPTNWVAANSAWLCPFAFAIFELLLHHHIFIFIIKFSSFLFVSRGFRPCCLILLPTSAHFLKSSNALATSFVVDGNKCE